MKVNVITILVFSTLTCVGQIRPGESPEMHWELDYEIFLKLSNDSSLSLDVNELFHISPGRVSGFSSEFVYYPVSLNDRFVESVRNRESVSEVKPAQYKTLWGALHGPLGGGWVHFTNCLLYALQTEHLSLKAPLMERPDTRWKPKPVTETYKRTRKWDYYVPVKQRYAIKEYKLKKEEGKLGDLQNIPERMIQLFLNTNNREYKKLKAEEKIKELAQIDLIKLLLGSSYLSGPQITYIRSSVLSAVKQYTASKLPTVVVFDEFDAAVAMSLNEKGYEIENIVFRGGASLDTNIKEERRVQITQIIDEINRYNHQSFQKRLERYYGR